MSVQITYYPDQCIIDNDKRIMDIPTASSQALCDALAYFEIAVSDENNSLNSFKINGTLINFIENVLLGLKKMEKDKSYKGLVFDLNQSYVLNFYLSGTKVLFSHGEGIELVHGYDFDSFNSIFKEFAAKSLNHLEQLYEGLDSNANFIKIKQKLISQLY